MKVRDKSSVYDAVKYKPGMEDGFFTRYHDRKSTSASSGIPQKTDDIPIEYPYIQTGDYQNTVTESDWILTDNNGGKHVLTDRNFRDNYVEISDGYHTFDELYYHRMVLFSIICNQNKERAWKSWLHSDGTMFEDYFIVGMTTPKGDFTYHYHKDHWDRFAVKELDNAPTWDGHNAKDIERLLSLI